MRKLLKYLPFFVSTLLIIMVLSMPVYGQGINIVSDDGDRVGLFEDLTIDQPVEGNVIAVFGNVELNADVDGMVITILGDTRINNSRVSEQVISVLGNIQLEDKAVVLGDLISVGQLQKAPGAEVLGQEINILGKGVKLDFSVFIIVRAILVIMFSLIVLMVGLLYIASNKNRQPDLGTVVSKDPGKKLLLGFLAFLGATILFLILFITIIVPVLYFALMVLSTAISCIYSGKLITRTMSSGAGIYTEFFTGLVTITLALMLAVFIVPGEELALSLGLSGLILFIVNSYGTGVLLIEKYKK